MFPNDALFFPYWSPYQKKGGLINAFLFLAGLIFWGLAVLSADGQS